VCPFFLWVASFAGYADDSAAMSGIAKFLSDFYSSRYSQGGQALRSTIAEVQSLHRHVSSFFGKHRDITGRLREAKIPTHRTMHYGQCIMKERPA
jgi:hypothetical protein